MNTEKDKREVWTNEELEKAARLIHFNYRDTDQFDYGDKVWAVGTLRAALNHLPKREVTVQDSGLCGGCRDLGPHRNVPNCDFYEPPVHVDGARLLEELDRLMVPYDLNKVTVQDIASDLTKWLRGGGR